MPTPSILVATWGNGLFSVTGKMVRQELVDQSVRSLVADGHGRVLAIVGGHSLYRRTSDGEWSEIAKSEFELSCCVPIEDVVFVGTNDARVLRVDPDGAQQRLTGFDAVTGREKWYAGAAIVDGKLMGPPLGIRSMAATCDGAVLLANVHVGGVPRSTDGGLAWQPTIDIESDVHQVCAHPTRPEIVIAAAAAGLCISRDAGTTWTIEQQGLHAHYCSAVAFGRNDIFVAASTDHFATQGAVYRRPIDSNGPLKPLGGGMPMWIDGIADTNCIATRDSMAAVIDRSGRLYVSHDDGASWSCPFDRLTGPSGLHISRPMRDRKAVARYAGLTGSPDESGAKRREQGLARAGNARVRRGMIQLAWRFLLFQKQSALAQWYRARTADSRVGTRKTMIVALARKLLIALWRFATTGETLEGVIVNQHRTVTLRNSALSD